MWLKYGVTYAKKNNNNDERDMALVKFLLITCVKQTRGDYSEVSFDYCTLKKQWKHWLQ